MLPTQQRTSLLTRVSALARFRSSANQRQLKKAQGKFTTAWESPRIDPLLPVKAEAMLDYYEQGGSLDNAVANLAGDPLKKTDLESFTDAVIVELIDRGFNENIVEVEAEPNSGIIYVYLDERVVDDAEDLLSLLKKHGPTKLIARPIDDPALGTFTYHVRDPKFEARQAEHTAHGLRPLKADVRKTDKSESSLCPSRDNGNHIYDRDGRCTLCYATAQGSAAQSKQAAQCGVCFGTGKGSRPLGSSEPYPICKRCGGTGKKQVAESINQEQKVYLRATKTEADEDAPDGGEAPAQDDHEELLDIENFETPHEDKQDPESAKAAKSPTAHDSTVTDADDGEAGGEVVPTPEGGNDPLPEKGDTGGTAKQQDLTAEDGTGKLTNEGIDQIRQGDRVIDTKEHKQYELLRLTDRQVVLQMHADKTEYQLPRAKFDGLVAQNRFRRISEGQTAIFFETPASVKRLNSFFESRGGTASSHGSAFLLTCGADKALKLTEHLRRRFSAKIKQ